MDISPFQAEEEVVPQTRTAESKCVQVCRTRLGVGMPTIGRVDRTAHETLAEGQFNTFYMRGLCRYAIGQGILKLEFYRAGEVLQERSEFHARIGQQFSPETLLKDLAVPFATHTETGLPPEPNSTISLRIPRNL